MRTLKKVLALTVVLATVFSLTAFAAFTDADQINESCQDDINLMNALNVMVGDAEGTFRPNGTISRAEAAKMVYVVRNGGVDDKASGWTGMKVFNDVPAGAWYEGYVNYCASLGIIAGVGGNRFNPDGAVTGVELAKMLLVVAGYKPDVQGYTGANWSLNVINDAQQAYMFEGYALAFSASAPRQWAAKLFSNAILKTQTAVYFNGELVNGLSAFGEAKTVGEKYFGLDSKTGILDSTFYTGLTGGLTANKVCEIKNEGGTSVGKFAYNVPASLLGQEVTVVYKETNPGSSATLDDKDTVYNVYATGKTNMVTTTRDAATLSDDGLNLKLANVNGGRAVTYTSGDTVTVLTNGCLTKNPLSITNKNAWGPLFNDSNENVTLILNDNNKIKYAIVDNAHYAFINKIDLDKGLFTLKKADGSVVNLADEEKLKSPTLTGGSTLTFGNTEAGKQQLADYVVVPAGLEAGNLVKYTASIDSGKLVYTFEGMTPATSGAMTVRATDKKSATIGGTAYALGKAAADLNFNEIPDIAAADTYNVFSDGKYAIYVTNESGATANAISGNVAYVLRKSVGATDEWGAAANKVQVLQADGTNKAYAYASKPTGDAGKTYIDFANVSVDGVYEYVVSGEKIYFRSWSYNDVQAVDYNATVTANDKFAESTQRFGAYPTNSSTYIFFIDRDNDVYKVVRTNELKDGAVLSTRAGHTATIRVNNIPTIAFGVSANLGATVGNAVYGFTSSAVKDVVVDGKVVKAINMTLSTGEVIENAVIKGETTPANGTLYKVTPIDNGYSFANPSGDNAKDLTEAKLLAWNSETLQVFVKKPGANVKAEVDETTALYNITADTQIFYVDNTDSPAKLTDAFDYEKQQELKMSIDSKGNIVAMYVFKNVAANTAITTVDAITLPTLYVGEAPSTTMTGVDGKNYTAKLTWEPNKAPSATTEAYTAKILLEAKLGYEFGDVTSVTVGGSSITGANLVISDDKQTLTLTKTDINPSAKRTPITEANVLAAITDATGPIGVNSSKASLLSATVSTGSHTQFSSTAAEVFKDGTATTDKISNPGSATLTGGCTYYVKIALTAEAGYKFDSAVTSIALTGKTNLLAANVTAALSVTDVEHATLTLTYAPAKVAIAPAATSDATKFAITLAAPSVAAGAPTGGTSALTTGVSAKSVAWFSDENCTSAQTAAPTKDETYYAKIVLEAADGYELTLANFVEANIKPTGGAFVSVSSDSETKTVTLILSIAAVD